MKAMSRLWVALIMKFKVWAVLVSLTAVSFLAFGTANADPMSNTNIAWWTFTTYWGPEESSIRRSITPFTFSGISGDIVSVAYRSTGGPTRGRWVYAYQIQLKQSAAPTGTIFEFSAPTFAPPATVRRTRYFSFWTEKPSGVWPDAFPEIRAWGISSPTSADYTHPIVSWRISLTPTRYFDVNSTVFGYVSGGPPINMSATLMIDNTKYKTIRTVYVASPEPASALLLGIGLLGIGMFRRRKR